MLSKYTYPSTLLASQFTAVLVWLEIPYRVKLFLPRKRLKKPMYVEVTTYV